MSYINVVAFLPINISILVSQNDRSERKFKI
jgi:hypothetical protein